MNSKVISFLRTFGLVISILLNIYCIREIIKYEPDTYKNRHYYNLKQKGWFDKEVSLSELNKDSTYILVTLGQSNAGNSSNVRYQPIHNVLNYNKGHLYKASEPLIGSDGSGGTVWTILADMLIDSGLCKNVVIVPVAVGSTNIQNWASGDCNKKLIETLDYLNANHIKATHFLWHQGEADNGSSYKMYKVNLKKILETIRSHNQNAPFYCSIASYNPFSTLPLGVDSSLENTQFNFVKENKSVFLGPNTDTLIYAIDRFDGQHFSGFGNKLYANLWFNALKYHREE